MVSFGARMGSGRRSLMAASLLLNVFLVAVVSGQYLHRRAAENSDVPVYKRVLHQMTSRLDRQDAEAFRSVLHSQAPRFMAARQALEAAHAETDRELMAKEFDPAALRVALAHWQKSWDAFMAPMSDTLVDAIAHLSPEGRRRLASGMPHPNKDR